MQEPSQQNVFSTKQHHVSVGPGSGKRNRKRRSKLTSHVDSSADVGTKIDPGLEATLLQLTTSGLDPVIVRNGFRKLAIDVLGAIGSGHVIEDSNGNWVVLPYHATGRLPVSTEIAEKLSTVCATALARKSIQIQSLDSIQNCQAFVAPVGVPGAVMEVFLIVVPKSVNTAPVLMALEKLIKAFQFWCRFNTSASNDWKLTSLSAMIELVSKIESCETVDKACQLVVRELAQQLDCTVAISGGRGKSKLKAISDVTNFGKNSKRVQVFRQALRECSVRNEPGLWPAESEQNDVLLLAHKQLANQTGSDCVRTFPLITPGEKKVGEIALAGSKETVGGVRCEKFLRATTPRIANAIAVVSRAERSPVSRFLASIPRALARTKPLIGVAAVGLFVALMFVPMNYRVRTSCIVEPVQRRFAVAPFDGLIREGFVKPGDQVVANQQLAEMDGRSVRWELAGIAAERQQAIKEHDVELANRNVSAAMLAQLEDERLAARQQVLEFQQQNLSIVSPIDGVVLSGSKERTEAASVKTGESLFEVAPLSPLKIELEIPADEIAHIQPNMPVTVWIDGQEQTPLEGKLVRIFPRSELRQSSNVFVAEFEFDNSEGLLRPGMKGSARIDAAKHSLGWNLFHKPYDFVSSRMMSWW